MSRVRRDGHGSRSKRECPEFDSLRGRHGVRDRSIEVRGCEPRTSGFESRRSPQIFAEFFPATRSSLRSLKTEYDEMRSVGRMVRHRGANATRPQGRRGSIPRRSATFRTIAHLVERLFEAQEAAGSSPARPATPPMSDGRTLGYEPGPVGVRFSPGAPHAGPTLNGYAAALQAVSREFDSPRVHQIFSVCSAVERAVVTRVAPGSTPGPRATRATPCRNGHSAVTRERTVALGVRIPPLAPLQRCTTVVHRPHKPE